MSRLQATVWYERRNDTYALSSHPDLVFKIKADAHRYGLYVEYMRRAWVLIKHRFATVDLLETIGHIENGFGDIKVYRNTGNPHSKNLQALDAANEAKKVAYQILEGTEYDNKS